jgi:tryptophan synthase beta chain
MLHDERYYGRFGGRYVPEVLRPAFEELEAAWEAARADGGYWAEIESLGRGFIGRPTPLCFAERLSAELGIRLYLKLEGLAQTGAHKINNALGQALLAKRMGKVRVIAETGAGQHGLATASAAAKLGLECEVFSLEVDLCAAEARPCWPAPVSAITRALPMRFASRAWPRALLILCAPVLARPSSFR